MLNASGTEHTMLQALKHGVACLFASLKSCGHLLVPMPDDRCLSATSCPAALIAASRAA